MSDDYKFQWSASLPPVAQYAKGDMLNVRAETAEELNGLIDGLFGEGSADRVLGRFNLISVIADPPESKPAAPTQSAPSAPTATGNVGEGEGDTCPKCGKGTLTKKNRKDGNGTFIGCDRFRETPKCAYIVGSNR